MPWLNVPCQTMRQLAPPSPVDQSAVGTQPLSWHAPVPALPPLPPEEPVPPLPPEEPVPPLPLTDGRGEIQGCQPSCAPPASGGSEFLQRVSRRTPRSAGRPLAKEYLS